MSEPYIGQIVLFAGNFAPRGWAFCDGQILSIAQNTALFSILGTTYGGNGQTTFGLPDLRGRVPLHVGNGQGPGLSPYVLGQQSGTENVTLNVQQMPQHNHLVTGDVTPGSSPSPSGGNFAQTATSARPPVVSNSYTTGTPTSPATLNPTTIQPAGNSQPHPNIQPILGLNFIIALQGIFPPRN